MSLLNNLVDGCGGKAHLGKLVPGGLSQPLPLFFRKPKKCTGRHGILPYSVTTCHYDNLSQIIHGSLLPVNPFHSSFTNSKRPVFCRFQCPEIQPVSSLFSPASAGFYNERSHHLRVPYSLYGIPFLSFFLSICQERIKYRFF